ncbi:MAG: hypothetical protein AABZ06_04895, partial [Bdellovibrionota bacterium]
AHRDYLASKPELIRDFMRSMKLSNFLRAFYEDTDFINKEKFISILGHGLSTVSVDVLSVIKAIDVDPGAHNAWDLFKARKQAMEALPDYQALHIDEISDQMLDFILGRSSAPGSNHLAERLRIYLAERAESGDVDQLLALTATSPDEFYQVFSTASRYVENGELKEFLKLIRRGLSESR